MFKTTIVIAALVALTGCQTASQLTANTTASVGPKTGFSFNSNKNQENLKASGKMAPDGTLEFQVETSATTPEAAIARAAESYAKGMEVLSGALNTLLPLVQQGIAAGAASQGVPLPKPAPKPVP